MSGFRPRFFLSAGEAEPGRARTGAVVAGPVVTVDAEDSYHALKVLRLRAGDECEVVVGAAVYAASVLPVEREGGSTQVRLRLGDRLEGPETGAHYERTVALVQALSRPSALDWSIEKSTEAGVSLIFLVQAAGSPRPAGKDAGGRQTRWARIAREAAKQSKQPAVPPVEALPSFAATLARVADLGLLPVLLDPEAEDTLYDLVRGPAVRGGGSVGVALWIGPESGWTADEREELERAGLAAARLGRGVLRTETAGPVAVAIARLALGDW